VTESELTLSQKPMAICGFLNHKLDASQAHANARNSNVCKLIYNFNATVAVFASSNQI